MRKVLRRRQVAEGLMGPDVVIGMLPGPLGGPEGGESESLRRSLTWRTAGYVHPIVEDVYMCGGPSAFLYLGRASPNDGGALVLFQCYELNERDWKRLGYSERARTALPLPTPSQALRFTVSPPLLRNPLARF